VDGTDRRLRSNQSTVTDQQYAGQCGRQTSNVNQRKRFRGCLEGDASPILPLHTTVSGVNSKRFCF